MEVRVAEHRRACDCTRSPGRRRSRPSHQRRLSRMSPADSRTRRHPRQHCGGGSPAVARVLSVGGQHAGHPPTICSSRPADPPAGPAGAGGGGTRARANDTHRQRSRDPARCFLPLQGPGFFAVKPVAASGREGFAQPAFAAYPPWLRSVRYSTTSCTSPSPPPRRQVAFTAKNVEGEREELMNTNPENTNTRDILYDTLLEKLAK